MEVLFRKKGIEKTDLLDIFQGFYDFVKENVLGVFFSFYGGWGFNNLRVENSTFLLLSTDFLEILEN